MEPICVNILYTQTNRKLKLCLLRGGGGAGSDSSLMTPVPTLTQRDTSGVRRWSNGEGGRQVITWRSRCRETRQRLKTVKSNRSRERESVMYNIIYTLQLGLHLELRTSPKEVTFEYKGQVIQSRDKEKRSGCCRFTILWGESRFSLSTFN